MLCASHGNGKNLSHAKGITQRVHGIADATRLMVDLARPTRSFNLSPMEITFCAPENISDSLWIFVENVFEEYVTYVINIGFLSDLRSRTLSV